MASASFIKLAGGSLVPANGSDAATMEKVKNGSLVYCEFVTPRNAKFHRRFFALLNLGFEYWDPEEVVYHGQIAEKNFDKFRGDITILAGFYDVVTCLNGRVQLKPKSIKFGKMDDSEFQQLYKSVFNVIWRKVMSTMKGWTPEKMEAAVNQLLSFDS